MCELREEIRVPDGKGRGEEEEKVGIGGSSGWWETDKASEGMLHGVPRKTGCNTLVS